MRCLDGVKKACNARSQDLRGKKPKVMDTRQWIDFRTGLTQKKKPNPKNQTPKKKTQKKHCKKTSLKWVFWAFRFFFKIKACYDVQNA